MGNSIDEENKNNTQNIFNIHESIRIQTEQVQKVDDERQQAIAKAKEDFEANAASNEKAINDLRKDLAESITNIEITLKQDQERDNSTLNERILIIKETSDNNKSKIESLEKVVPETSKSLALEVDAKMRSFHDETFDKLSAAEQKINKNRDNIESQAKIIENNTENITNIFSNNATISSQINSMENKAEDLLKYLQVERQRIDNLSSDLQDVDENLKKTVPEVKRNTDRLDSIDTTIENLAQKVVITTNKVQENDKEIEILKEKFLQQNNSLLDIGDRVNDNKDNIDKMEEKIDGLCKTVEIIEGRQVETVEKVKEVTVLFGNLQQQIKDQEEKIMEKSATDLTQIKNQIKDIESHNDLSDKKIKDLDSGSQALLEKLIGLEKEFGDRFVSLDKTDDNLLIKINSLETGNIQNITDIRNEVEKRLDDVGNKLQEDHESLRKETLVLIQDMSNVKTHITNTENKFVEIDAGNQQLLDKFLGIEKDLDGKLHGVNENTNTIQTRLDSIDKENKNNTQNIFNIHENIRIQTEQVQKLDDERQQSIAKAKED